MSIEIESLVYRFPNGVTALDGVSLRIDAGERVAIAGQNGAGKTTLVRHLNGIVKPTSGTVTVDGWNTADHSTAQLAAKVGYLFQNPDQQLFARTVRQDVEFGPRNLGYADSRRTELVSWALEATGLTDRADSHPYELSLSDRKRVALAAVLAMDTPIVVLDEPTTGQDHNAVGNIASIIANLHEQGKTVVAITHDMDFCAENFDRTIFLAQGRIITDAPTTEAFTKDAAVNAAALESPQILRLTKALSHPPATTVDQFIESTMG
ncbi:energy-coupling factor ABC transporter ATP-binding protein [Saccharopolyspora sp. K220]|uniref:energy-coupling factor ABC transporter ATP-binding protein n=1 Tax=Saccharopolyspora soli TaxID=2926618 RepID=UPI001F570630|nr:ABC transporter ATP-binding protein [Saccharopolyspora soli]MCI2417649.1 energy-coupling factor ABC transporter ATP-binding protein [Saccharopolyspora soli]